MDDMNPFEELHEFVKGIMQCLGGRDLCRMKRSLDAVSFLEIADLLTFAEFVRNGKNVQLW